MIGVKASNFYRPILYGAEEIIVMNDELGKGRILFWAIVQAVNWKNHIKKALVNRLDFGSELWHKQEASPLQARLAGLKPVPISTPDKSAPLIYMYAISMYSISCVKCEFYCRPPGSALV